MTALLDCGTCSEESACEVLEKFRLMLRILALVHIVVIGLSIAAAASVVAELSIIHSKYDVLIAASLETNDKLWLTLNQGI